MASCSHEKAPAQLPDKCQLGVCTVDLSGPHDPTPRPGRHIQHDTCTYFLVLALRPDCVVTVEVGTQTGDDVNYDAESSPIPPTGEDLQHPLVYSALLANKFEACSVIKEILAQVNNDHGNLPHTVYCQVRQCQVEGLVPGSRDPSDDNART